MDLKHGLRGFLWIIWIIWTLWIFWTLCFFWILCFSCMFFTVEGVFCLGSCSIESAGWRPRTFLDCVFLDCVFLDCVFLDCVFFDCVFLDCVFLDCVCRGEGVAGLAAGRDRLTVTHGVGHQGGGLGGVDRLTVLLGLGGGVRPVVLLCAGHQGGGLGGGAGVAAGGYRPDVWDRLRRWRR